VYYAQSLVLFSVLGLKRFLPEIQVVMARVYRDHDRIPAVLKAVAPGLLLKRSKPEAIRQAIRDVRSRTEAAMRFRDSRDSQRGPG
jgi:DNA-binding NarL/FixJ family response regulator